MQYGLGQIELLRLFMGTTCFGRNILDIIFI